MKFDNSKLKVGDIIEFIPLNDRIQKIYDKVSINSFSDGRKRDFYKSVVMEIEECNDDKLKGFKRIKIERSKDSYMHVFDFEIKKINE